MCRPYLCTVTDVKALEMKMLMLYISAVKLCDFHLMLSKKIKLSKKNHAAIVAYKLERLLVLILLLENSVGT